MNAKGSGKTRRRISRRLYWPSFSAPALILLVTCFILPMYVTLSVAFGTTDYFLNPVPVYRPWQWNSYWFAKILRGFGGSNAFYRPAMIRTFTYVLSATAICLVVGYAVAYYVARLAGRYKRPILALLIAPFFISYILRVYAWVGLLQTNGLVNQVLRTLRLTESSSDWLNGRPVTLVLGLVYGYLPWMILPIFAQLDHIDDRQLEASRDLGASSFWTFVRVTIPLSIQGVLAGLVIVALPMFGDYFTNNLLSTTKTAMLGNLIDTSVQTPGEGPLASGFVLVILVLLLLPVILYLRSGRDEQRTA